MSRKRKRSFFSSVLGMSVTAFVAVILFGVAGFTFYQLMNQGVEDAIGLFGVSNFYIQNIIILGIILIVLTVLGIRYKTAIKKIVQ